MSVTVRGATPADHPALEIIRRQAIEAACAHRYPREQYADLVATPDPELQAWIGADQIRVYVAETAVTPVSYAAGDAERAHLLACYTAPDYERRGYASKCLERIEADLRGKGHAVITVWATEPSHAFFTAHGFEGTGEHRQTPLPAEKLRKPLR